MQVAQDSKKYIYLQVLCQWISLICQIIIISTLAYVLNEIFYQVIETDTIYQCLIILAICLGVRFYMQKMGAKMSYLASKDIKVTLRKMIFSKLLEHNQSYREYASTAEIVQLSVEGVDQLETYFGRYLPQFFYSLLAPLTLFAYLVTIDQMASLVLLICVPLIPISIMLIQKFAKRLLSKYWGMYANLGERFLDNIRGLTTLKIYGSDEERHQQMNEESEKFRKITMRVLVMQLNSISVMDLVAFGGAAIGIVLSLQAFQAGDINVGQTFIMIMLSAEFFIPLRLLGSFFHIAMNGNAASKKIFGFLDSDVYQNEKIEIIGSKRSLKIQDVSFAYEKEKPVLSSINMDMQSEGMYSIVGESGCGKSTLASILSGVYPDYDGSIKIADVEVKDASRLSLLHHITLISDQSYIFKGNVRSNLSDGKITATDDEMWNALHDVNLAHHFRSLNGLDSEIQEKGNNLSGGQIQRLALARALLKDTPIYIFDESTSNVDVESENDIMEVIHQLAERKIVILIAHRLANVKKSKWISVMSEGVVEEVGSHGQLLAKNGLYARMFKTQSELENFVGNNYE